MCANACTPRVAAAAAAAARTRGRVEVVHAEQPRHTGCGCLAQGLEVVRREDRGQYDWVSLDKELRYIRVDPVHVHVEHLVLIHHLPFVCVARAALTVDEVRDEEVPVVRGEGAEYEGLACGEDGQEVAELHVERLVRRVLLLREQKVLARVLEPMDIKANGGASSDEGGERLQQQRRAKREHDNFVRVHKESRLGDEVRVELVLCTV